MRVAELLQRPAMLVVLICLAGSVVLAWPRSTDRRQARVEKWATQKLVRLSPDVARALDRALTSRDRFGAAALALIGAGSIPIALGHPDESASVSAVWTLSTTAVVAWMLTTAWRLARPWFAVDAARSARARAATLRDYVFPPVRWLAWGAALACLAGCALALPSAPTPAEAVVRTAPLLGVAATTAMAEWVGRRTVDLPQPARDAAELYALDAWRCELAGDSFQILPLWAVQALIACSLSWSADDATALAFLLISATLLVLVLLFRRFPGYNITWTRHRLWPELPDGTIIETKVAAL